MKWLFSCLVFLTSNFLWADPNDYNPCGQYNSYMGNLCEFDKEADRPYPYGNPISCSDCNMSSVKLGDKTKFNPNGELGQKSGGEAEGTD